MKKTSQSLSLVLMGSLTVGLSGCGSDEMSEEYRVYQSIEDCVKEEVFTPDECRETAIAAVRQNPQFNSVAECEAEFGEGNCKQYEDKNQQAASGERRSSWMPLLAGYMVGRYLGGGAMMQGAQPVYQQPGAQQGNTGARSVRTLGGGSVQADSRGKVNSPSQAVRSGFTKSAKPAVARAGSGSRGGFSGGKASS